MKRNSNEILQDKNHKNYDIIRSKFSILQHKIPSRFYQALYNQLFTKNYTSLEAKGNSLNNTILLYRDITWG